ncbi:hypothetical protein [Alcaligenes faecalis]|uniref:hypothetical protein n=1 Tax=Alcaligenes faecalis TaxID=511 RepID=UPI0011778924|nr:hypothetical protein [Alcaligenes faecalis]
MHPVAHVQLLAGQAKLSCTGDALTDTYYCFSYKSRSDVANGTFLCGEHAAKDFLQLIKHPGLPLFNPLRSLGGGGASGTTGSMSHSTQMGWNSTAKQLHDAIHLLIVCWASAPGPALADIKRKLEEFSRQPPLFRQIKAVNTILGKDVKGRSLSQMVSEIAKNNSIKTYDFSMLDAALTAKGIPSNFTRP